MQGAGFRVQVIYGAKKGEFIMIPLCVVGKLPHVVVVLTKVGVSVAVQPELDGFRSSTLNLAWV